MGGKIGCTIRNTDSVQGQRSGRKIQKTVIDFFLLLTSHTAALTSDIPHHCRTNPCRSMQIYVGLCRIARATTEIVTREISKLLELLVVNIPLYTTLSVSKTALLYKVYNFMQILFISSNWSLCCLASKGLCTGLWPRRQSFAQSFFLWIFASSSTPSTYF